MRDVDTLVASGLRVMDAGFEHGQVMAPLFSGGHDSLCAVHMASQHPRFTGDVYHIDTGIGAKYTRGFVNRVCEKFGWRLHVLKSKDTYEKYVSQIGFPGPGRHQFVYNRLKDRCVYEITKGPLRRLLITGCRSEESVRRMGHVEPVKVGELVNRKIPFNPDKFRLSADGVVTHRKATVNRKRIWTAPCHDWSKAEQALYMDEFGLPVNRFKVAVGMSGECGCGCFAAPGEKELWREHAPEVVEKIDRLAVMCRERNLPCEWGKRPEGKLVLAETGPMCTSCDYKLAAQGAVIL